MIQPLMELMRCDSCGRPLTEGSVRRGEAEERGPLIVCATCVAQEAEGIRLPINVLNDNRERFDQWYESAEAARARESEVADDLSTAPLGDDTDVIDPLEESRQAAKVESGANAASSSAPTRGKPGGVSASKSPTVAASSSGSSKLPPSNLKLPQRRHANADGDSGAYDGNAPINLVAVAQPRSSMLPLALTTLVIVGIVFAVVLWLAIQAQIERDEKVVELERQAMAFRDKLSQRAYENQLLKTETERARIEAQREAALAANRDEMPSTGDPNAAAPPPQRIPGLSDAAKESLAAQERELAERARVKLKAATAGERIVAIAEVAHHRIVGCIPDLRPLLASEFVPERMLAAEALGKLGDKESLEALRRMASSDPDRDCRETALFAIAWITGTFTQLDLARFSTSELRNIRDNIAHDPTHTDALEVVKAELRSRGVLDE